jgi:hypothetical protein
VPPIRIASLLFACLLALPCAAQQRRPAPGAEVTPPADEDEARTRLEKDMAKKARQERHAALISDSDKLLKLAVELKAYVDKSNENVLSLEVIRRAEEIEKLAHSVKDKMKGPN